MKTADLLNTLALAKTRPHNSLLIGTGNTNSTQELMYRIYRIYICMALRGHLHAASQDSESMEMASKCHAYIYMFDPAFY